AALSRLEVRLHHLGRVAGAEHAREVRHRAGATAQHHQHDHDRDHHAGTPAAPLRLRLRVPGVGGPSLLSLAVRVLTVRVLWRRLLSPTRRLAPLRLLSPAGLLSPGWLLRMPARLLGGWRLPHDDAPFRVRL